MFGVVVVSYGGLRGELGTVRRALRRTDEFRPESELAGFVRVNADRLKRDAEGRELDRAETVARAHDSGSAYSSRRVRPPRRGEKEEEPGIRAEAVQTPVSGRGVRGGVGASSALAARPRTTIESPVLRRLTPNRSPSAHAAVAG